MTIRPGGGQSTVQPQARVSADQASSYTVGGSFTSGTNTLLQSRRRKRTLTGGTDVMISYPTIAGLGEGTPPSGDGSNWTLRASVEYPAGTFWPAYSQDGNRDVTVTPGGSAVARLYVPGFDVPANADWWVRTRIVGLSTGAFLATVGADGVTEWGQVGTGTADYTLTNTSNPAANTTQAYTGVVSYRPFAALPCVGGVGDSITFGKGDPDANGGTGTSIAGGWFARAMSSDGQTGRSTPSIPNVNMAITSETLANWSTPTKSRMRLQMMSDAGVTNFLVYLGTNDVATGNTATMQTQLLTLWTQLSHRGRVFGLTLAPLAVTSTDAYATVANQTPGPNDATVRVPLNQWLRAGAPIDPGTKAAVAVGTSGALLAGRMVSGSFVAGSPLHPLYQVCDTASTVESSQDSGKWLVGYNLAGDGTHPSTTGHQAIALKVRTEVVPNLIVGVGHAQQLIAV